MKTQHNNVFSWRRLLFLAFPPLAAILFALALVTPASAAVIKGEYPYSFSTVNPCNGENVAVSAVLDYTVQVTSGANGSVHVNDHQNTHLTGVGDQGNTYVGNEEQDFVMNGQIGMEFTSMLSSPFISQGSAPNFQVHAIVHVTINPNGTATAFVDNFTATCQV